MWNYKGHKITMGGIKVDANDCKCIVMLRDFPSESFLLGLVTEWPPVVRGCSFVCLYNLWNYLLESDVVFHVHTSPRAVCRCWIPLPCYFLLELGMKVCAYTSWAVWKFPRLPLGSQTHLSLSMVSTPFQKNMQGILVTTIEPNRFFLKKGSIA